MNLDRSLFIALASAALLAACAGQPETYTMNGGQSVTMPKGTMTGSASVGDANALAQMVVDGNANAMVQFDRLNGNLSRLQASQAQQLQASQQALSKLEQLSDNQGSGQITLFFGEGSARLNEEQQQRLIRFVDYIARDRPGPQGDSGFSRKRVGGGTSGRQPQAQRHALHVAAWNHRAVSGEHSARVLQGLLGRRHVCAEKCIDGSRAALPERAHYRSIQRDSAERLMSPASMSNRASEYRCSP